MLGRERSNGSDDVVASGFDVTVGEIVRCLATKAPSHLPNKSSTFTKTFLKDKWVMLII